MSSSNLTALLSIFITSLHILHHASVLDAYGHLSFRNPSDPATFFMSRNMPPALVSSPADVVLYHVANASAVDANAPEGFIERYIHSEAYKRFGGVEAVVHAHAEGAVPFSVVSEEVPLKPVIHVAGFLGEQVPVFDISKFYTANDTQDLLVRNVPLGAALAAEFSSSSSSPSSAEPKPDTDTGPETPDHLVVLMQNHGFTTCSTTNMQTAVFQAIYTQVNAEVQAEALAIQGGGNGGGGNRGDLACLTPKEAADSWESIQGTIERPWSLWVREVQVSPLYENTLDPSS